ncbi:MAG: glycosyltransferase [Candidatus Roizmanbacteria bacterium]
MDTLNKHIVISTHYLVYGASQALLDYLNNKKIYIITYVQHPLFINGNSSTVTSYVKGVKTSSKKWFYFSNLSILKFALEIMSNIITGLFMKKSNVFFGFDSLNAFSGIILRFLKKTNFVVYYTIDYVPERFSNSLLNNIYHLFDKFCITYADEVWNVSPRISEGREQKRGLKLTKYPNQRTVPIGIWFDKIKRLPFEKISPHKLFFIGNIQEGSGLQYVIKAIPDILKEIPDFFFLIVGGGDYLPNIQKLVKELRLAKYIKFTGWIIDRNRLDTIMADSALAVALYDKQSNNYTYYADPTKPKDYLSAGLPIIMNDLPHYAYDLEKNKCAIIIESDPVQISNAIIKLLSNSILLQKYRKNALNYIKKYDWNIIFDKEVSRIL